MDPARELGARRWRRRFRERSQIDRRLRAACRVMRAVWGACKWVHPLRSIEAWIDRMLLATDLTQVLVQSPRTPSRQEAAASSIGRHALQLHVAAVGPCRLPFDPELCAFFCLMASSGASPPPPKPAARGRRRPRQQQPPTTKTKVGRFAAALGLTAAAATASSSLLLLRLPRAAAAAPAAATNHMCACFTGASIGGAAMGPRGRAGAAAGGPSPSNPSSRRRGAPWTPFLGGSKDPWAASSSLPTPATASLFQGRQQQPGQRAGELVDGGSAGGGGTEKTPWGFILLSAAGGWDVDGEARSGSQYGNSISP